MKAAALFLIASLATLTACGEREEAAAPEQATPIPQGAAEAPARDAPATTADAPPIEASPETGDASESIPSSTAAVEEGAPNLAGSSTQAPAASMPSAAAPSSATPSSAPAAATGSGTVLKADKLYSAPSASARVTASVAKGAKVDILAKEGGWLRVKAGSDTGWIRLLSVRAGTGGLGGAALGDVVGAATTRSDPTRVVAVAGLRGLNDEDLKQAQFNAEELARLEARNPSATQVRSFASQAGLAAASVPDLPKPQAQQSSSTWESN